MKEAEPVLLSPMATHATDPAHGDCEYCPSFQHALELVGRRWTGSILKVIGDRSLRFGEIRSEIPGLSDRLLDARLTELENENIIERCEVGSEVSYVATPKGIALRPAFDAIGTWAYEFPTSECADALPGRRRT